MVIDLPERDAIRENATQRSLSRLIGNWPVMNQTPLGKKQQGIGVQRHVQFVQHRHHRASLLHQISHNLQPLLLVGRVKV